MTFIYYYRVDSTKEAIGRVTATSLDTAREQIALIKKLNVDLIDNLFVIERLNSHENDI
jgi:hypothetical protein